MPARHRAVRGAAVGARLGAADAGPPFGRPRHCVLQRGRRPGDNAPGQRRVHALGRRRFKRPPAGPAVPVFERPLGI